ncbi:alpha-1,2-fucosyltransferase [Patescibacteria group bacterium]|nr:alpha-1,2-fucosyltransferase [Patescibacteria group bacterium]
MVISKIIGGLGNQMFQYAMGRAVAERNQDELVLDNRSFNTYFRKYSLDQFCIQGTKITDKEATTLKKYEWNHSPFLFLENQKPIPRRAFRRENPRDYFQYVADYQTGTNKPFIYLDGYWQNEGYFKSIREILLNEFTLKPEYAIKDEQLLKDLAQPDTVSLHIRRGDYLSSKATAYGVLPASYYQTGLDTITNRIRHQPTAVYIFTDDPTWVIRHLHLDLPMHIVSQEIELTDSQELVAMSLCHHQIIANSTFSWWAAWLNTHSTKQIVAPFTWIQNDNYSTWKKGPVPDEWERVENELVHAPNPM